MTMWRTYDVPVGRTADGEVFYVRVEALWPPESAVAGVECREVER